MDDKTTADAGALVVAMLPYGWGELKIERSAWYPGKWIVTLGHSNSSLVICRGEGETLEAAVMAAAKEVEKFEARHGKG